MNFFALLSIISVLGAVSIYSLTGISSQTIREQDRSANIIRGTFQDDGQKKEDIKAEVKDAKITVVSDKEAGYSALVKIGAGNDIPGGGVTLSIMNIDYTNGRLKPMSQGNSLTDLDVIITFEPAKEVLGKEDRNRLFTIGYSEEKLTNPNTPTGQMIELPVSIDLDALYRSGGDENDGTNMIRAKGYNTFKMKGSNYNVRFMFNKDVFYQVQKEKGVEIKNIELLSKDLGEMSDFSIGNNYMTQFQSQ